MSAQALWMLVVVIVQVDLVGNIHRPVPPFSTQKDCVEAGKSQMLNFSLENPEIEARLSLHYIPIHVDPCGA